MPDDSAVLDITSPALNTPQTDNTSIDYYADPYYPIYTTPDGPAIKSTFADLAPLLQQMILALWYLSCDGALERCANCGHHGSVHRESGCVNWAEAYRHTCHVWICSYCGRPMNRLYAWARMRALHVATTPQIGIEVIGPLHSDVHSAAKKLAQAIGVSSNIRHKVVEVTHSTDSRVRMVIPLPDIRYTRALEILHIVAGPSFSLQIMRNLPVKDVLCWLFAATDAVWSVGPDERAMAFAAYKREHLIRTNGDFYSPIEDGPKAIDVLFVEPEEAKEIIEELEATAEEDADMPGDLGPDDDSEPTMCPCGCGPMRIIPKSERKIEPISEIEKRYKHVIYSNGRGMPPARLNRIDSEKHTVKSEEDEITTLSRRRYGPS